MGWRSRCTRLGRSVQDCCDSRAALGFKLSDVLDGRDGPAQAPSCLRNRYRAIQRNAEIGSAPGLIVAPRPTSGLVVLPLHEADAADRICRSAHLTSASADVGPGAVRGLLRGTVGPDAGCTRLPCRLRGAPICRLLLRSGPPTVAGLVVAVAVDAVNGVARPRLRAHVGVEVFEGRPSVADRDSSGAVVLVAHMRGLGATAMHLGPGAVFGGMTEAVSAALRDAAPGVGDQSTSVSGHATVHSADALPWTRPVSETVSVRAQVFRGG